MNRLMVLPVLVGHDQEQVIAAVAHMVIDEETLLARLLHLRTALFQHLGVHGRMAHITTDIGLNGADSDHSVLPSLCN